MTKQYIGTKIIKAFEQQKDGKDGYGVIYADGYTSWSPKDVFEEAYIVVEGAENLQPHQVRVVAEKAELDDRHNKLIAFFSTPIFYGLSADEQRRLAEQCEYMGRYSSILGDRIAAF